MRRDGSKRGQPLNEYALTSFSRMFLSYFEFSWQFSSKVVVVDHGNERWCNSALCHHIVANS